jgi:hypothetical protein
MRKLIPFICVAACLALVFAAWGSTAAQDSAFATNTPDAPVSFATNTPDGPVIDDATDLPTLTPSHTLTPSPTLTPSVTPTFTWTPSLTPTITLTPSPTATIVGPQQYPQGWNPLTGLPYPDEEAMNRRNLIIKISNFPPVVRPQSGINQADVVYEYEVEGGVTRFAAIYRSNAPRHVGPVRSGRLVDLELVPMYEALFSYSGASEPVNDLLLGQPWSLQVISPAIGDNCREAGFCRFPGDNLVYEHTLYADTEMIWARAEARGVNDGYRARGFAFSDIADEGGEPADDIFIDWYGQTDARWQFDPGANHYVRWTDGLPHYDRLDGQQLWTDNLIIIEVPHEERPDLFEPESQSASQQINLWDTGRAYLFRDGQWYQGYWRRRDLEPGTALEIIHGDGTPIMMRPGRTWVSVVRWLGDTTISSQLVDMQATGTALAASFTPTPIFTEGPRQTAEATLVPGVTLHPPNDGSGG